VLSIEKGAKASQEEEIKEPPRERNGMRKKQKILNMIGILFQ
jgi:hypothetical protein